MTISVRLSNEDPVISTICWPSRLIKEEELKEITDAVQEGDPMKTNFQIILRNEGRMDSMYFVIVHLQWNKPFPEINGSFGCPHPDTCTPFHEKVPKRTSTKLVLLSAQCICTPASSSAHRSGTGECKNWNQITA